VVGQGHMRCEKPCRGVVTLRRWPASLIRAPGAQPLQPTARPQQAAFPLPHRGHQRWIAKGLEKVKAKLKNRSASKRDPGLADLTYAEALE